MANSRSRSVGKTDDVLSTVTASKLSPLKISTASRQHDPLDPVRRHSLVFWSQLIQHFVPERRASLLDLAANILGVLIGLMAYRWLITR
jgi:hypothetical protein